MRVASILAALLLCLGWVSICRAQPFDKVTDETTYAALDELASARLLGDYTVPAQQLSRLEVALLLQTALKSYAAAALNGKADEGDEALLSALTVDYREELLLLGSEVRLPSHNPSEPPPTDLDTQKAAPIEERVAQIESWLGEQEKAAAGKTAEEQAVETTLYGNIYLQTRFGRTDIAPGDHESFSDVDIYWGELGVDSSLGDWSGHFSVLLDDAGGSVLTNEAWAKYQPVGKCGPSPWFFQVGRILVPFGNNPYYFPTYPAVNDLGYSTLHAIGGGYSSPNRSFSAFAYNARAEVAGDDDTIADYTAVWDIAKREAQDCHDGYKLTVGYNSHLASHDLLLAGNDVEKRVPGVNLYGKYDWNDNGRLVHVLADYTCATGEFDPADLDANGDTIGDKPAALNTELVFEPKTDTIYGISYQATSQLQDYAETRWGVVYGERLNKLAKFKLELTHGEFGDYATGGQQSDNTFVGEINLSF